MQNIEVLEFFESHMMHCGNNLNRALEECAMGGSVSGAEILLDLGADITTRDDDRNSDFTPLHWAVYYNHTEMVRFLLDRGADTEETTSDNQETALHIACREGEPNIIKLLLERGANVNAKDSSSMTPLHVAARTGEQGNCELLVKYGADIKADCESGTPADYAINNDYDGLAYWLNSL